jgi:hypothetical protein
MMIICPEYAVQNWLQAFMSVYISASPSRLNEGF